MIPLRVSGKAYAEVFLFNSRFAKRGEVRFIWQNYLPVFRQGG